MVGLPGPGLKVGIIRKAQKTRGVYTTYPLLWPWDSEYPIMWDSKIDFFYAKSEYVRNASESEVEWVRGELIQMNQAFIEENKKKQAEAFECDGKCKWARALNDKLVKAKAEADNKVNTLEAKIRLAEAKQTPAPPDPSKSDMKKLRRDIEDEVKDSMQDKHQKAFTIQRVSTRLNYNC